MVDISTVRRFWEENPLWAGESKYEPGSREFFEEHRIVYVKDCLAGRVDNRILPPPENRNNVLDLGCGPGFWTVELLLRGGARNMIAADLTERALALTRSRIEIYELCAETRRENAEHLSFESGSFDHVNCQGVIHHTPDTAVAIAEIARVLRPRGTACISVYYRNVVLRNWRTLSWIGTVLNRMGAGLLGRGRDRILTENDPEEIVRRYDGADNPVGKAYSRSDFEALLKPNFEVCEVYFHYFPARSLPFPLPKLTHRLLDRILPFMIYANVRKP